MTDEVDLTPESFRRWLRAQRPPFVWFLGQAEMIQEQMACLGEEYVGVCIDAGMEAGAKTETEAEQVQRIALEAIQKLQDRPQGTVQDITHSMGGVTKRRERRERAQQDAKDGTRSLMGRPPDEVEP